MTALARQITQRADSLLPEMTELLGDLVGINSHSANVHGINLVGHLLTASVPSVFKREVFTGPDGVEHRLFTLGERTGRVVLLGHMDTVFSADSPFQRMTVDRELFRGPGTADMKGGLVVMVYALRILEEMGLLANMPICCLVNGDEEIGSPFSRGIVKGLARGASCGLVFECAGLGGEVVTARRGVIRYRLHVAGKARHAGAKLGSKASALVEMARMVLALEGLNDEEEGLTVNVGRVEGGTVTNIVPDSATALFEARFWDDEGGQFLAERIWEVASRVTTPDCTSRLELFGSSRPAMAPVSGSDELLAKVQRAGRELGQAVGTQRRGGASDGNILAAAGVPTLDGFGPVGDLDHSEQEYILRKSLTERVALVAMVLEGLTGSVGSESFREGGIR